MAVEIGSGQSKSKGRLRIDGVRVRGTRQDIDNVAHRFNASALVVALPLADAELIRELSDLARAAGLDVLILPPVAGQRDGHSVLG